MRDYSRFAIPAATGRAGELLLTGLYFAIVSLAESPSHALQLFWEDRFLVTPILLGFGVQVALYTVLKKRLFVPAASPGPSGALTGAGSGLPAREMVACCAHRVTDVLALVRPPPLAPDLPLRPCRRLRPNRLQPIRPSRLRLKALIMGPVPLLGFAYGS